MDVLVLKTPRDLDVDLAAGLPGGVSFFDGALQFGIGSPLTDKQSGIKEVVYFLPHGGIITKHERGGILIGGSYSDVVTRLKGHMWDQGNGFYSNVGVLTRYTDVNNHYVGRAIGGPTDQLQIAKMSGGCWILLGAVNYPYPESADVTLRFVVSGSTLALEDQKHGISVPAVVDYEFTSGKVGAHVYYYAYATDLSIESEALEGYWVSDWLDAGKNVAYRSILWSQDVPEGATVTVAVRAAPDDGTGNPDEGAATLWVTGLDDPTGSNFDVGDYRWWQVKVNMSRSSVAQVPKVFGITLSTKAGGDFGFFFRPHAIAGLEGVTKMMLQLSDLVADGETKMIKAKLPDGSWTQIVPLVKAIPSGVKFRIYAIRGTAKIALTNAQLEASSEVVGFLKFIALDLPSGTDSVGFEVSNTSGAAITFLALCALIGKSEGFTS